VPSRFNPQEKTEKPVHKEQDKHRGGPEEFEEEEFVLIVLYFGNELVPEDRAAIEAVTRIRKRLPGLNFIHCISPEEVLLYKNEDIVILDAAKGTDVPREICLEEIKKTRIASLHDFDLGLFLKLLKKVGKIPRLKIVAVPQKKCDDLLVKILNQMNSSSRK
jgi:Ni,Fe-hydrogenase maturation factor